MRPVLEEIRTGHGERGTGAAKRLVADDLAVVPQEELGAGCIGGVGRVGDPAVGEGSAIGGSGKNWNAALVTGVDRKGDGSGSDLLLSSMRVLVQERDGSGLTWGRS